MLICLHLHSLSAGLSSSLSLLNLYLPYHWPECCSDCAWHLFWASHKNSVQWSLMQCGVCPRSRNKPICFYKALIIIQFSQCPAHTDGRGLALWVQKSLCMSLRHVRLIKKCLDLSSRQVKTDWKALKPVFPVHIRLSIGEVMVPDSCSNLHGLRSGVFVIEVTVFSLKFDGEVTKSVSSDSTVHKAAGEERCTTFSQVPHAHTTLWSGFRCPWWKAWPLALQIDTLLFMP